MAYLIHDSSSGTDDDLPNHCLIQTSRGIVSSATARVNPGSASRETNFHDMEFQIHGIETEAYGAVLRAFIAQSDVLSWEKEELITELRKELRVSDVEHRQILGKINSDDSVKSIRECRKSADAQQLKTMNPPVSEPTSVGHAPRKRMKPAHAPMSSSPKYPPRAQPLPMGVPSLLTAHVRGDQWGNNAAVFSTQMNVVPQNRQTPSSGKVKGSVVVQTSKKGSVHLGHGNLKPGSDIIEIRATDKLIHEVEKVCGGVNPDPAQVDRAKLMLREHERALMEAIGKLADVSEDDDSPDQLHHLYSVEEQQRNVQGFHNATYEQFDRSRAYYSGSYIKDHAERAGLQCIDLQDD